MLHGDARGFFVERFNAKKFEELGLPVNFVQDNHSRSQYGVVRGLHFQLDPFQGKLVGVLSGRIQDVVVDIRRDSSTYGMHASVDLDDISGKLLWVPAGFAHGFCVTSEGGADVMYKVDCLYDPNKEKGIRWNDAELNINWQVENPVVSHRDSQMPSFKETMASLT